MTDLPMAVPGCGVVAVILACFQDADHPGLVD